MSVEFIFIILMTVLLHDVKSLLLSTYGITLSDDQLHALVYADDTLLLGSSTDNLQKYLQYIAHVGENYGLALNWKKVDQMNIQYEVRDLIDEDGNIITYKSSIKYLGSQLQADGKIHSEIAQKIGEAHRTIKNLKRI